MSPKAQRIAIAEACGWKNVRHFHIDYVGKPPRGTKCATPTHYSLTGRQDGDCWLPDYVADLNAIHEAEKILTDGQVAAYEREMANVILKTWKPSDKGHGHKYWHATAAQRAEAFLKIIGKWNDSQ